MRSPDPKTWLVVLIGIMPSGRALAAVDNTSLLTDAARAEQEGRLSDAKAFLHQVRQEWPRDDVKARYTCELGLRIAKGGLVVPETVAACHRAFLLTQSAHDMRNKAAAMLSENERPDLDTLAIAALLADASAKKTGEPWGALARHDIAIRLGRADLLETSRADLARFANDPMVKEELTRDVGRPSALVWLLRVLALLGIAVTLAHAVKTKARTRTARASAGGGPVPTRTAQIVALLLVGLAPAAARATEQVPKLEHKLDQISPFKIDDEHPELAAKAVVEKEKDPLQLGYIMQDIAVRADDAWAKGDFARAGRYYHALGVTAPTVAFPARKECASWENAGDLPSAVRACRMAIQLAGTNTDDFVRFVELVLKDPQPLSADEPKELAAVIAHLEQAIPNAGAVATTLRCQVALRFNDTEGVNACAKAMKDFTAEDPRTISIKWGIAVQQHDKATAMMLVERGRRAGLGEDTVRRMIDATDAMSSGPIRRLLLVGGLALVVIALGFLGYRFVSAGAKRTAERAAS